MAISIVNLTSQANATPPGGSVMTGTVPIPAVSAGNILVVVLAWDQPLWPGGWAVWDSADDNFSWANWLASGDPNTIPAAGIWYCLNPTAGANSVTWRFSSPPGSPCVWVYEINGGGQSFTNQDNGPTDMQTTAGASCVGKSMSAAAEAIFFAAVGTQSTVSAVSAPWTLDPTLTGPSAGKVGAAHLIQSSGAAQATFTQSPSNPYGIASASFVLVSGGGGGCEPATLAQAITDLCERAGLARSEIDISLISNTTNVQPVQALRGYLIDRPTTAAQALQEILRAYFIDACETNGTIKFVPRGYAQSPPLIPESDLGLVKDETELVEQQAQEEDLPVSTTVLYTNQQYDYQQGKQIKQRNPRILTVATRNMRTLSLPFVFLPDEARQIAEADLYSSWDNRLTYKINLWRAFWALLDPTDRVQFVYEGNTYNARLTSSQLGQGLTVALEAALEDYRDYSSTVTGGISQGSGPPTGGGGGGGGGTVGDGGGVGPPALAATMLWLLDIPLLQDADAHAGSSGFYAVMSSGTASWPGAILYESSTDASFSALGGVTLPAAFGYPSSALAAPSSPWAWDTTNSLTIQMVNGSLAGSTDAEVLAGANGLVIGQEILQFVDCTDNGGGSFTISRLLRGRRGTDNFCGTHAAGEVAFAPLSGGFLHQVEPVSHIGQLWYYRGVTNGGTVDAASDVTLTLAGNDLKPYSVVDIGGTLDTSNNWTITWTRRTRAGGSYGTGADALIDGMNGPLNEQTEAYEVDVMSGSTVKRTISTHVATAVYTAAQQTADFGAVQTTLTVNIYQISATVGRGFEATANLPISGGAPPASVISGDTYVN